MKQSINKKGGFTIIEVVLVLAIAALLMLMVFLAWPALQRSQRDQARKDDVAAISTAIATYRTNNKGRLPKVGDLQKALQDRGLSQYDPGTWSNDWSTVGKVSNDIEVKPSPGDATISLGSTGLTVDKVFIYIGSRCESGSNDKIKPAGSRQAAIIYATESSGFPQVQCLDA